MTWVRQSDSFSWSPGHLGKGYMLHDGVLKTWNVDPYLPLEPREVWERNNELSPIALSFEIDPDGGIVTTEPTKKTESIVLADPRMYDAGQRPVFEDDFNLDNWEPQPTPSNAPDFNFVNASWRRVALTTPWGQDWDEWDATRQGHQLGYDPKDHEEGKGFILQDGSVWTWPTYQYRPVHAAYSARVKGNGQRTVPGTAFHIEQGQVYSWPGRSLTPEQQQHIFQADPRLSLRATQTPPPGKEQFGHGQRILDILDARDRGKESAWRWESTDPTMPPPRLRSQTANGARGRRPRSPDRRDSARAEQHDAARARVSRSSLWDWTAQSECDEASSPSTGSPSSRDSNRQPSHSKEARQEIPRRTHRPQAPVAWSQLSGAQRPDPFHHYSDYQGWTNWETWHVALMMDNEGPTYRRTQEMMESGASTEQLQDYLIRHVIGPYNRQQIKDAKEWNAIPLEERQRRKRQHDIDTYGEAAVNMGDALMQPFNDWQNEDKSEEEIRREQEYEAPDLIDTEQVNFREIWDHLYDEIHEDQHFESEQQRLRDQGLTFAMPGHDDETNQMLDAWLKHHGITEADQRLPSGGSAEHHTRIQVPIEHLPMDEGEYTPEDYAKWWQQGYGEPRARSFGYSTLHDIQRGRANPWQTQTMQQALQGQGYTPEQIEQIMRQRWLWDQNENKFVKLDLPQVLDQDAPGDLTLPEGFTATSSIDMAPAVELREWLADLGGAEPEAPSIHHDSEADLIQAPPVSTANDLPYFPPANIPKEYKRSSMDSLECPVCLGPVEYRPAQGYNVTHFWCPKCHRDPLYGIYDGNLTGIPMIDEATYRGAIDQFRYGALKTADSPITQADATNDPLGKNPAIIPSREGDPDYLQAVNCQHCQQPHRPDQPCPDSAAAQYKQMERQWAAQDPNAVSHPHGPGPGPDGLQDHQMDLGKLASEEEAQTPETFYHVAPASRAHTIESHGLDPEAEQRLGFNERGVYLWDSLDHARRYAQQQFGDVPVGTGGAKLRGEPYHIYEVTHDPDALYPDPYRQQRPDLEDYAHSWQATEPIPPESLRRI